MLSRATNDGYCVSTLIIEHCIPSWVLKFPTLLNFGPTIATQTAALAAENVDRVEHHNIWRLACFDILQRARLIEKP